uniref:Uncharacterized protein n=1 Tax=Anguilla anguilla TaxID=7936 RepID=A0A0E9XAE2_ANGAN
MQPAVHLPSCKHFHLHFVTALISRTNCIVFCPPVGSSTPDYITIILLC